MGAKSENCRAPFRVSALRVTAPTEETLVKRTLFLLVALAALLIPGMSVVTTAQAKPAGTQACTYTDWVQGQWYTAGSIVKFQGSYYIAEHDNPGYSPTESTWYWDPTSCGDTPPPAGCNYPDWVQGQWYTTGSIVKFQGS